MVTPRTPGPRSVVRLRILGSLPPDPPPVVNGASVTTQPKRKTVSTPIPVTIDAGSFLPVPGTRPGPLGPGRDTGPYGWDGWRPPPWPDGDPRT